MIYDLSHPDGKSEIINQKSEINESCGLQVAFLPIPVLIRT